MRPFSEGVYQSLRYSIAAAYDHLGGVSKFVGLTRPKLSTLSKYGSTSRQNAEIVMPIDVAIDLDRAAGRPIVLAAMADVLGYDIVPRQVHSISALRISDADAFEVNGAAMDLGRVIRGAAADGVICGQDNKAILVEVADLEHVLHGVRSRVGVYETC